MSLVAVRDGICRYFGGDYDEDARAYLTPAVEGLGVVKRARGKRTNRREFHEGMGTETHGTAMLVHLQTGDETRITTGPAGAGIKRVTIECNLHVFLHSTARNAEDAQDAFYELQDRLLAHLRADPTLGSGGFDGVIYNADGVLCNPGGFQLADGHNLRWELDPVETDAAVTRGYLVIGFDATQYVYG